MSQQERVFVKFWIPTERLPYFLFARRISTFSPGSSPGNPDLQASMTSTSLSPEKFPAAVRGKADRPTRLNLDRRPIDQVTTRQEQIRWRRSRLTGIAPHLDRRTRGYPRTASLRSMSMRPSASFALWKRDCRRVSRVGLLLGPDHCRLRKPQEVAHAVSARSYSPSSRYLPGPAAAAIGMRSQNPDAVWCDRCRRSRRQRLRLLLSTSTPCH